MALTFGTQTPLLANARRVLLSITFDASYVTGGEAIVASDIGLGEILHINFNQGEDGFPGEFGDRFNRPPALPITDPNEGRGYRIPGFGGRPSPAGGVSSPSRSPTLATNTPPAQGSNTRVGPGIRGAGRRQRHTNGA